MLKAKSSDLLLSGGNRKLGVRFVYADVTESVRALAESHLAGPAAELVLGEALAAVAIMSRDLSMKDETITLNMKTNGPIGSVLVEASYDGALRGFTGKKILDKYDGIGEQKLGEIYGSLGTVVFLRTVPGRVLSRSGVELGYTITMKHVLSSYVGHSEQRDMEVAISAVMDGEHIASARGFLMELMPEGNEDAFQKAKHLLTQTSEYDTLDEVTGLQALLEELELDDGAVIDEPRALRFACRCSKERAENMLRALPKNELLSLSNLDKDTDIYCQMCGKNYTFSPKEIAEIASEK